MKSACKKLCYLFSLKHLLINMFYSVNKIQKNSSSKTILLRKVSVVVVGCKVKKINKNLVYFQ